jgi:translation initiation factor 3 subunit M
LRLSRLELVLPPLLSVHHESRLLPECKPPALYAYGQELTDSLNYTYNFLSSNSPLRPTALLALLSVLSLASDLEALAVTPSSLSASINQWAVPTSEKINFLTEASEIYKSANLLSKALEFTLLALNIEVSEAVAEKAIVLTLANETKFDLSEVLKTQGVTAKISGKAAELVKLFTEADELDAVSQGQTWAQANESYLSGFCKSSKSACRGKNADIQPFPILHPNSLYENYD